MAGGYEPAAESTEECLTPAVKARNWFISSYPLLVALASSFKIIEDPAVCARMDNVTPESMAERVKVRGRGGTVLQPGIDILEKAGDFPEKGPVLTITDGSSCDRMRIHRDHAFLIPRGSNLPFPPRGKVFRMN